MGCSLELESGLNGLSSKVSRESIGVEEIGTGFLDEAGCREVFEQASLGCVSLVYCCYGKKMGANTRILSSSLTQQDLFGTRFVCQFRATYCLFILTWEIL